MLSNLEVLKRVLEDAQNQTGTLRDLREFQGHKSLRRLLGDYDATLKECELLLENRKYFESRNGIIFNIKWNAIVDGEVSALRERLGIHNVKVSLIASVRYYSLSSGRFRQH